MTRGLKRMLRRGLAGILSIAMLCGNADYVRADDIAEDKEAIELIEDENVSEPEDGGDMHAQQVSVEIVSAPDVVWGDSEELIAQGNFCGIDWKIDTEGKLTVTGEYTEGWSHPTWFDYKAQVKSVSVSAKNVQTTHIWFQDFENLETVDFSEFDTSQVTDMSLMFSNCYSLKSLDLSEFDTSKVTDMSQMFFMYPKDGYIPISNLTSLDVSKFDTKNVTDMRGMFLGCGQLTNLDVSGFDTGNVTDMSGMFQYCSSLTSLDVSHFDTKNVTDISWIFNGCTGLTSLDVSKFDTRNVTNMEGMFSFCTGLTSLDVCAFDTHNVTNMSNMFWGCTGLTGLDVSAFDTCNVTDMNWMFGDCTGLTSLDVSTFDTCNVTDMSWMFENCSGLTSLNVSTLDTSNVTNMLCMFRYCSGLTSLDVSHFNTENVANMMWMFCACDKLTSLDISHFNTENVTDMRLMFSACSSLERLDLSGFHIREDADIEDIFNMCSNLTVLKTIPQLQRDIALPVSPMYDAEGNEYYQYFPKNLPTAIWLAADPEALSTDPKKLVGISLSKTQLTLRPTETATLTVIYNPSDTTSNKSVTWTSSDKTVASVDASGVVTAVQDGSATITAKVGTFTASCTVTVSAAATDNTLVVKQKTDITARFAASAPYKKYTVTPKGTATVTSKGILTAKKPAETVTVTGLVKEGKVWKEAESVTFKIEAPAIVQKTITATKPGMTIQATDNIAGTTITPTSWISSKPAVAEIDAQTGVITTKAKGITKITAMYGEGKNAAKYTFNVKVNIPVMSKAKATMLTGATLKLKLKNVPKDRISDITWESSDNQAAEVDSTGKVNILAYAEDTEGKVTITATIDEVPYSCEITVKRPEIKKSSLVIKQGKSGKVALKYTKLKNIQWTSLDETIATVDAKGKVVGVAPGTVIIQTTTGGVINTCEVTVK